MRKNGGSNHEEATQIKTKSGSLTSSGTVASNLKRSRFKQSAWTFTKPNFKYRSNRF